MTVVGRVVHVAEADLARGDRPTCHAGIVLATADGGARALIRMLREGSKTVPVGYFDGEGWYDAGADVGRWHDVHGQRGGGDRVLSERYPVVDTRNWDGAD